MSTLKTRIFDIHFENPFLLASAPPTALIESIDKAFEMGWAGAVLKTITPDDLEMIEEVSLGIAMGNAVPELKNVANYVTTNIEDEGIEFALKHFGLINQN